jgi:hypothetical protein
MLETLRMQEVSQIILSKPEGAVIRQNRTNPQEKGVESFRNRTLSYNFVPTQ